MSSVIPLPILSVVYRECGGHTHLEGGMFHPFESYIDPIQFGGLGGGITDIAHDGLTGVIYSILLQSNGQYFTTGVGMKDRQAERGEGHGPH